jgi:hypothetical protein
MVPISASHFRLCTRSSSQLEFILRCMLCYDITCDASQIICNLYNNKYAMDFAPYQDQSPETNRALSPPPEGGRRSFSPALRSPPLASPTTVPKLSSNAWAPIEHSSASAFGNDGVGGHGSADVESGRGRLNEFETSLPLRLDYEACLAYLLLPPAGGVLLLVMEQKSDYVRWVLEFNRVGSGGARC